MDHRQRALFAVDVEAGGAKVDHEQGPALVAGKPNAVAGMRSRGPRQLIEQSQDLARRIVGEALFEERGHLRTEQPDIVDKGRVKSVGGEALSRDRAAEEVAILPDEITHRAE